MNESRARVPVFTVNVFRRQVEAINQSISVEQSQSDRSKRPFKPVLWVPALTLGSLFVFNNKVLINVIVHNFQYVE